MKKDISSNEKLDPVYYSNNPKEWETLKNNFKKQIEELKRLSDYIKEQLRANLNEFNIIDFHKFRCFTLNSAINYKHNFEIELIAAELNKTYKFSIDSGNIDKTKLRDEFINLLADINYFLGVYKELIHSIDLEILILQGKSLSKEFLHLTNAAFLKDLKIKSKPYHIKFKRIKTGNIKQDEINYLYDIFPDLTISKRNLTDRAAFIILSLREKNNIHFIKLFDKFDISDIDILDENLIKFKRTLDTENYRNKKAILTKVSKKNLLM
jgi:hypothetical protein